MKLKNLLLMGLAAVGFMACSSNDDLTTEEARTSGGDAYASFTIDLGSPYLHTRAGQKGEDLGVLEAGDEHYGTAGEQEVKRVLAVMYAGGVVAHVIDYNDVTGDDVVENKSDRYHFVTVAKKVKKQNYEVAIIVNPTDKVLSAIAIGKRAADLTDAVVEAKVSDFNNTEKGFLMTNAQGLVQVKADDLKTDKDEAKKNPISVQVDRVLAKVVLNLVGEGGTVNGYEDDKVEVQDWTLDITNKKTYLLRHAAKDIFGQAETSSTPRFHRYAIDPNFTLGNLAGLSYEDRLDTLKGQFNFYTLGTDDKEWNTYFEKEQTKPGLNKPIYALENTFAGGKENATKSQGTRVVLRAAYQPKDIENLGDSWFSYAGKPFEVADLNENFQLALQQKWNSFIGNMPATFVNEMKNLVFFSAYIANLEAKIEKGEGLNDHDEKFVGGDKDNKTVLAKYKRLAEVVKFEGGAVAEITKAIQQAIQEEKKAGLDRPAGYVYNVEISKDVAAMITLDTSKPFAVGNLKHYLNGDNYYFVYVKHFDHATVSDPHAYGRYGLVRNNVYKVNIKSINKPGEPVITPPIQGEPTIPTEPVDPGKPDPVDPEKPDPEKPIDDEFNYVSYDVQILPWVVREQTEEL